MRKLNYKIEIKAPKDKVYQNLIGKETFKQWTSEFHPTSDFEGSWEKGEEIRFIGYAEDGKKEGMLALIEENMPNELISIRHYGVIDGENEIFEGPKVEAWAPAYEIYTLSQEMEITYLAVEVDAADENMEYFDKTWPKALNKLKDISES